MSVFKKLLARVGIGAAQVDTHLFQNSLVPGETLEGEVHISGGDVAQEIDDIYLKVATEYEREYKQNDEERTIHEECILIKYLLSERFLLQTKEKKVISFSLQLPYETPLTMGRQPVYLQTGLDIKSAVNPRDRDELKVQPHPLMQGVLEAVENLGFRLQEVDCEYTTHFHRSYPFVQEFEFRPTGKYRRHLDELEVIFCLSPEKLEVLLQIDKRARGFKGWFNEAFDLDERYDRFYLTQSDLAQENIAATIDSIIQSHLH
ncbi:sporulation protein [Synechocystis sp. PCC 7509]|uniref:sporulation protein n=1 Tax=Synechocystis sp. PCC 7509 TaxID=927677 RepID=UPI0002ACE9DC|nr:sporulation protein [Synechocystis sp. PCC 7509]